MRRIPLWLLVTMATGMAQLASPNSAQSSDPSTEDPGYQAYMRNGCYACHGTWGQGSVAGAPLAPNVLPLAAFTSYLRAPAGVMPPYDAKVLDDATVAKIHAYLGSIPAASTGIDPFQR